uniref:Putative secreted protein n=1 Tax=Aedes albopictus TaxID=7160 RepID=A0A023EJ84_AEDAL
MSEAVIMNRVFRYFMKFHGYFIAFCTIFFTSVIIVSSFTGRSIHEEPFVIEEEFEAVQRYPILIQVESALWLCASVILAVGLYKENKSFLTPFLALFIIDGAVVIVQEILNLCTGRPSELATIDSRQLVVMILVNVYVLVSLVVLYRMFAKGPLPASQNNFVRFDNERDIEGQLPAAGGQQQQQQHQPQQQPTALNRS